MTPLTAKKIAKLTENKNGIAIRAINRYYRDQDESHLWPINNKFNATERAIRRIRRWNKISAYPINTNLQYCYALEQEISEIVNNESNW